MVEWPHDQLFYRKKSKTISKDETEISAGWTKKRAVQDTLEDQAFDDSLADGLMDFLPQSSGSAMMPPSSLLGRGVPLPQGQMFPEPLPLIDGPPPTPTRRIGPPVTKAELATTSVPPILSSSIRPLASPMSPPDKEAYAKAMNELIQSIHKMNGEWNRKHREYSILHAKAANMKVCNGTEILKRLKAKTEEGQMMDAQLRALEEKHVLDNIVDKSEQIKAKYIIGEFANVIKDLAKIKLSSLLFVLPLTNLPSVSESSLCAS